MLVSMSGFGNNTRLMLQVLGVNMYIRDCVKESMHDIR